MDRFAQATVYGLLQGGLLALIAVGFPLVWGVVNVVNLAHGAFVLIGAYLAWTLSTGAGVDHCWECSPRPRACSSLATRSSGGLSTSSPTPRSGSPCC